MLPTLLPLLPLLQRIEDQDKRIDDLKASFNRRLKELAEQVERHETTIAELKMEPAVAGTFPPIHEIQNMQVQVWHKPELTAKERMGGRTQWSLRFEYWHRGAKQPVINVALWPQKQMLKTLRQIDAPANFIECADAMDDTMLGGVVRHKAIVAGRPYKADQVVFLSDFEGDAESVVMMLLIGDQEIAFENFRAAGGTSVRSAKWFSRWTKPARSIDLDTAQADDGGL